MLYLCILQCFTIERLGRRPLIIGGFGVMGMCCAGITLSLILQVSEIKIVSEVNLNLAVIIMAVCFCSCLNVSMTDHVFMIFTQTHVSFMKYVSVGCVVGIIAGFCIGPGKIFIYFPLLICLIILTT